MDSEGKFLWLGKRILLGVLNMMAKIVFLVAMGLILFSEKKAMIPLLEATVMIRFSAVVETIESAVLKAMI